MRFFEITFQKVLFCQVAKVDKVTKILIVYLVESVVSHLHDGVRMSNQAWLNCVGLVLLLYLVMYNLEDKPVDSFHQTLGQEFLASVFIQVRQVLLFHSCLQFFHRFVSSFE